MIVRALPVESWTDQECESGVACAESVVEVAHRVGEGSVDAAAHVGNGLGNHRNVHVQRLATYAAIGRGYKIEAGAMYSASANAPPVCRGKGSRGARCPDDDRWLAYLVRRFGFLRESENGVRF